MIKLPDRGHGAVVRSTSERPSKDPASPAPLAVPAPPSAVAPTLPHESPRDFAELVRADIDFVWRVLRRLGLSPADADDATQQVFLVVSRRRTELAAGKERSFLYGTALRIAANVRRGLSRRRDVPTDSEPPPDSDQVPADALVERRRARALLDELLAELPPELARVLVLCEIERCTLAAVAELEGIPAGTAASRLRRARDAFREALGRHHAQNPFDERSR